MVLVLQKGGRFSPIPFNLASISGMSDQL